MVDRIIDNKFRIPDELFSRMEPLLPKFKKGKKGGRPRLAWRNVMDGIFYVLRTGCQWKAMPPEFGSGSAIHSYFQLLVKKKVFTKLWKLALQEYDDLIGIDWEWQSMDGAMSKAPLGGEKNRAQSHGPGQAGHEAVCIDRRGGHPLVRSRRRRQHA